MKPNQNLRSDKEEANDKPPGSKPDTVGIVIGPTNNGSPLEFFESYGGAALGHLPKYAQLREVLLAAIEDGFWKPNDKLPPESEIASSTPYSLGTVQKALNGLAQEGFLVRRHGHGTFVAEKLVVPRHCRFVGDEEGQILPIYTKLVSRRNAEDPGDWVRILESDANRIVRIDRAIDVGNEFLVYNRFFISADRYPLFLEWPLDRLDGVNFKKLLRQEYNLTVTHSTNFVRTAEIPSEICRIIGRQPGTAGFVLELVAYSGQHRPIYCYELYVPPTNRKLQVSDTI